MTMNNRRSGVIGAKIMGRALPLLLAVAPFAGCTPPEELDAADLGPTFEWDELMGTPAGDELPLPGGIDGAKAGKMLRPQVLDEMQLTPDRLAALPVSLRQQPTLARLALKQPLEDPIEYHGGVYGLVGPAKFFAASRERIKDDNRLYWIMVRVLSEKYGCFMTAKYNYGDLTRVTCRDKRQIVFWRSRNRESIQFLARQYDAAGFEIVVKNRKIVRISKEKVI